MQEQPPVTAASGDPAPHPLSPSEWARARPLLWRGQLAWAFARKEWHLRYRSAKLGYAWAVLQPLILMAVLLVVLGMLRVAIPEPRPLFLLSGLFPWHFASVTWSSATLTYMNSAPLLKKARFPRETMVLGVVAAHLVNLLLTLPLLAPLYLWYGQAPDALVLLLPLAIALQTAVMAGMAVITASSCVRFTDTFFIVQALLLPWFYATPIFYSLHDVQAFSPTLAALLWLNPLTGIMELFRAALVPGWPAQHVALALAIASAWAIAIPGLGWMLFRRMQGTFADWL